MKNLWFNISRVFFLAVFSFMILSAGETASAFQLFGSSEEKEVEFQATDVIADGEDITIKGNFKNNTENFQRIIGFTMRYQLMDDEGVILLSGSFMGEDFSIDIGKDLVPYTVTVKNKGIYDPHDVNGWNVKSVVKVEK